ncbi:MAG: urate hydroxylase PuuD [Deltaproteobacteria bacterium]|nr:urate hydroxylase PuuD [Deltaproteobacteria bacterium]
MVAHLYEWLALAIRWLHVIAGIAWIGDSFYFMWLDASLKRDESTPDGIKGESWSVHGGGFYRVIKFSNAPDAMPETLHWFKWQAYTTWLSGFALLAVVYWLQAKAFMVDAGGLAPGVAVGVGLGTLVLGWGVYTGLCKSPLGKSPVALAFVLGGVLAGTAYGLGELLSARAAYIHVGAMIGTWMAGNVAMIIIPNQRKIVAALLDGKTPDPKYGAESKLRSTHNNYLTLPVLFVMISNHYPMTYGHEHAWLVLVALFGIGALTRVFFNFRNAGRVLGWVLPVVAVAYIGLAFVTAPPAPEKVEGVTSATWSDVQPIITVHCTPCHSANPTHAVFRTAPNGVMYDTPEQVASKSALIKVRAVDTATMPLANETNMTAEERAKLGVWIEAGSPIP